MAESFEGYAILELMGHRRLAGRLSEATIAGANFVRIDIPGADGVVATQFYSPQAVYAITPTTEAIARSVALHNQPEPVRMWELPKAQQIDADLSDADDDADEDDEAYETERERRRDDDL